MRLRRRLLQIAWIVLSSVCALLGAEVVLWAVSARSYPRLTVSDPELGWKYRPTPHPVTRRLGGGGSYRVQINSDGFRDDEFTADPETLRVMVLGDSMTFGMETDQPQIFTALLEDRLEGELPGPVDVMNFGITGYSTAQQLRCLEIYGRRYPPRVVILVLFELNDFEDNVTIFSGGRYRPHYVLAGDRLVRVARPDSWQRLWTWLRDHSRLAFLITNRLDENGRWLGRRYPADELQKQQLMRALLREIIRRSRALGSAPHLFYIRSPARPAARFEAVAGLADAAGVPLRVLPLRKEEQVGGVGHWNARGHRMAAAKMLRVLRAALPRPAAPRAPTASER